MVAVLIPDKPLIPGGYRDRMRSRGPALRSRPWAVAAAVLVASATGCSDGEASGPLGALGGQAGPSPSTVAAASASVGSTAATPPASGSPPASGAPSVTPSPTMSLAVLVPPDLMSVRGYAYAKARPAVVKAFTPVAAGSKGVLSAPTVRAVRRGKTDIGTVAAMSVQPSQLKDHELVGALLVGLVKGMSGKGYTLRTRQVNADRNRGKIVVAFRSGSTVAAWFHKGSVVTMASSEPEETVLAYGKAYLAS